MGKRKPKKVQQTVETQSCPKNKIRDIIKTVCENLWLDITGQVIDIVYVKEKTGNTKKLVFRHKRGKWVFEYPEFCELYSGWQRGIYITGVSQSRRITTYYFEEKGNN